jgi:D-glycero-alpha-D-manno-heptose-7-phosphate kinase
MIISRTPFRVSFFGGGSDYPEWYSEHGGMVISTTINKYCYLTVRKLPPFFDYKYRIRYFNKEEVTRIEDIKHPAVREAIKCLNFDFGLEVVHNADLPARSGLGSSSTFTVGLLNALYALQNQMISKRELAFKAIDIEQKKLNENVGSQDQTAAAFGGFNRILFSGKNIEVDPLILSDARLSTLEDNLILCFTGFARIASEVAEVQIREIKNKHNEFKENMMLAEEALRVLTDENTSIDEFGKLLGEQWRIKKTFSNKITNEKIDEIYAKGIRAGALGGKLLGAGSGGFMIFYAPKERHSEIKKALKEWLIVPFKFEYTGSKIIYFARD